MAETTETIAADLGKSPRQVINYKKAVERHIGGVITFQQGKQYFYREEYVHLIRLYAKGEPLPIVHRQVEILPPMPEEPPQPNSQPPGELMLMTRKLTAPTPVAPVPLTVHAIDSHELDAQSDRNQALQCTFRDQIRAEVLGQARSFAAELKAEVKQTITRGVAEAYREIIAP